MVYEKNHSGNNVLVNIQAENLTYHAHLHHSFEFVFCISGEITVTIGGLRHLLKENQGALIPYNTIHSYETETSSELCTLLVGRNLLRDVAELFQQRVPLRYTFPVDSILRQQVLEYFGGEKRTNFGAKAILYRAFDAFMEENAFRPCETADSDIAVQMIDYIQENFREPLTLERFAKHIDYNYFYVSKLIKRNFGLSFTELLSEYRVACAKELLEEKEHSVSEIALMSGFGSIRNFNRIFLQTTGVTPREYARGSGKVPIHPLE